MAQQDIEIRNTSTPILIIQGTFINNTRTNGQLPIYLSANALSANSNITCIYLWTLPDGFKHEHTNSSK